MFNFIIYAHDTTLSSTLNTFNDNIQNDNLENLINDKLLKIKRIKLQKQALIIIKLSNYNSHTEPLHKKTQHVKST